MTATIGLQRMGPRDPTEPHRTSAALELFFDLVFVVAVAYEASLFNETQRSASLSSVLPFIGICFAIWWAWMNFTWFGNAFSTDDWLYRTTAIVQMIGVLVLASGLPRALHEDDWRIVTAGYLLMRICLVSQWVRLAISAPEFRRTAARYAIGISVLMALWAMRTTIESPSWQSATYIALCLGELSVPLLATHGRTVPWHIEHIADRYSLLTLIVLGEGLSVAFSGLSSIADPTAGQRLADQAIVAVCGVVILASCWWIYDSAGDVPRARTRWSIIRFAANNFIVFASVGAIAAGLESRLSVAAGTEPSTGLWTAVPTAVYVLAVWGTLLRPSLGMGHSLTFVFITGVLVAIGWSGDSLILQSICAIVLVIVVETRRARTVQPNRE